MSVKIRESRNQLYLDIYSNGKRKWEKLEGLILIGDKATDKATRELAKIAMAKRSQQVFSGEWGIIDPTSGKQTLMGYLKKIGAKRRSADNINLVQKHLEKFPNGSTIKLSQITEKWIQEFQEFLLSSPKLGKNWKNLPEGKNNIAKATALTYAAAIRFALNQAVREKVIISNPALGVKTIRKHESKKVYLNSEELQRLASVEPCLGLNKIVKNAFLFACYTGLRISDLETLTWGDIDRVTLELAKEQKKTEDVSYIPLNATAWKIINDGTIHNHKELVFPNLLPAKHRFYWQLDKWAEMAGIKKKVTWHTARHTFAVQTLDNGGDLYTLSKLLGHTNIATTQVYAKVTDRKKREAVNALPPIELTGN